MFGMESFSVVLEEDGSVLSDELLADIISGGIQVGVLMLLRQSESWVEG
jgi:hypothetical protein